MLGRGQFISNAVPPTPLCTFQDFFGKPAFLTVSGQLEAEIYASSLGHSYTFGPTFRAEESHTTRHLAEFWVRATPPPTPIPLR